MPLTPADVHNVAFKKPPIGKRGYDEDEVDAFLDLVETEFARLIEENNDLRSRGTDTGDRPAPDQADDEADEPAIAESAGTAAQQAPALQKSGGDELSQASRMLALATETADRHVGEAKAQADRLLADARTSSEQMVTKAKTSSDEQLAEARTKSEGMLSEAKTRAQALTQDAERKQTEIMGGLEQRKSALEKEIENLRTFEREYRTRLKSYLESQLRDLDGRSSAEPADQQRPAGVGQQQNSANQPQS